MLEYSRRVRREPPQSGMWCSGEISLSKLQHILLSVGVRVPLDEREERKPQMT